MVRSSRRDHQRVRHCERPGCPKEYDTVKSLTRHARKRPNAFGQAGTNVGIVSTEPQDVLRLMFLRDLVHRYARKHQPPNPNAKCQHYGRQRKDIDEVDST